MEDLPNIEDLVSLVDDHSEDSDELDLVKLVSTNANDANQYLLFMGSDNQYYAKNVAKIEELLVYKDLNIVYNNDKESFILGTANIRGKMTSIVNFDKWIGNEVLDDDLYELVIIAAYGGKRFALVVKEVEYITTIDSTNMSDNSNDNSKSSFISQITINGKEQLCTIFDSDMLLLDIFHKIQTDGEADIRNSTYSKKSEKTILFADDSSFVRKMVEKLFQQAGYSYKMFKDGQELLNELNNMDVSDIGLFITDLEMPVVSGRDVIDFIRKEPKYNNINIIVHTNMANDTMEKELLKEDVSKVIGKVNMVALGSAIDEFII